MRKQDFIKWIIAGAILIVCASFFYYSVFLYPNVILQRENESYKEFKVEILDIARYFQDSKFTLYPKVSVVNPKSREVRCETIIDNEKVGYEKYVFSESYEKYLIPSAHWSLPLTNQIYDFRVCCNVSRYDQEDYRFCDSKLVSDIPPNCTGAVLFFHGSIFQEENDSLISIVKNPGNIPLHMRMYHEYPGREKVGLGVYFAGTEEVIEIREHAMENLERITIIALECPDVWDSLDRIHIKNLGCS